MACGMRLLATAALALTLAAPAAARESPEWTFCDFGVDPQAGFIGIQNWEKSGKEVGIAVALYGPGGRGAELAQRFAAVAACDTALASPDLASADRFRRSSLLQARAAHRIAAGDTAAALADLDSAAAAVPAGLDAIERARSVDVSIALLRAAALARQGDAATAVRIAGEAAAVRPWNNDFQSVVAHLLEGIPGSDAVAREVADRRARLDPDAIELRAKLRQAQGDFGGASADWRQVRPAVTEPTTLRLPIEGARPYESGSVPLMLVQASRVGEAALAAAFAGDAATARHWLVHGRAAAAAAPPQKLPTLGPGRSVPALAGITKASIDEEFVSQAALVEAAILFQAGRVAEARAAVAALRTTLPGAAVAQALARIAGQPAPPQAKGIDPRLMFGLLPRYDGPGATAMIPVGGALGGLLGIKLPDPSTMQRDGYADSNFFRPSGFGDRPLKGGNGRTIGFSGQASSRHAVEEMTLLRAAEVAVAAGHGHFRIDRRADYVRTLTVSINGSGGDSSPDGFVTNLDIVYTDAPDDRTIMAADVLAALGPLYRRP